VNDETIYYQTAFLDNFLGALWRTFLDNLLDEFLLGDFPVP
jgi:hypothetical protein